MTFKGERRKELIAGRLACLFVAVALIAGVATQIDAATPGSGEIQAILRRLEGLPLTDFLEASFREIMLRTPEAMMLLGLDTVYGVGNDRLNSLDPAYLKESYELEQGILALLRRFDRDALSPDQRLWVDTYEWNLEWWSAPLAEVLRYSFLTGQSRHSLPSDLEAVFFRHPLDTRADIEAYLARLKGVPSKASQIIGLAELQQETGFVNPRFQLEACVELIDRVLGIDNRQVRALSSVHVNGIPAYRDFLLRFTKVDGLEYDDRVELGEAVRTAFMKDFVPALWGLREYARELAVATAFEPETGLYAGDREAYEAELRAVVSTNLSPESIHVMASRRIDDLAEEILDVLAEKGFRRERATQKLFELVIALASASDPYYVGDRLFEQLEQIAADARPSIAAAFEGLPIAEPEIRLSTEGARALGAYYYAPPAFDGSRPGVFYIGGYAVLGCTLSYAYYHELMPGHHLHHAATHELDVPLFMKAWRAPGFAEGWATYSETLMWELGGYDLPTGDDLYWLYSQLLEAARTVLETGLHALGWTREDAAAYLTELIGVPVSPLSEFVHDLVAFPVDSTVYFVGRHTLLRLRDRARQVLGAAFELPAFHNAVIGSGHVPLVILDRLVSEYIAENLPSPIQSKADGTAIEFVTLWR